MSSISLFSLSIANSNATKQSQQANSPSAESPTNAFEQLISSLTNMSGASSCNCANAAGENSITISASSFSFNPIGANLSASNSASSSSDSTGDFINQLIAMLQDIGQSGGHKHRHHVGDVADQMVAATQPAAANAATVAGDTSASTVLSI